MSPVMPSCRGPRFLVYLGLLLASSLLCTASPVLNSRANVLTPHTHIVMNASIDAPEKVPNNASKPISKQFISWAVEADSFVNYTTDFSKNIFRDFAKRTGAPLIIRVGGTSLDHAKYDLSLNKPWVWADPSGRKALDEDKIFGKPFFEAFSAMPEAKYVIQVGLSVKNITGAVSFTKECIEKIGMDQLYAIEIGNEPGWYKPRWRGAAYDGAGYANDAKEYIMDLLREIPDLPKGRIFQVWDNSNKDVPGFGGNNVTMFMKSLSAGGPEIMDRIQSVAQHYYYAQADEDIQDVMLTHQTVKTRINNKFKESIDLVAKQYPALSYIISELGSSLGPGKNGPDRPLSRSLATAVWAVDFLLQLMILGMDRVHFQQGHDWVFNCWVPNVGVDGEPRALGSLHGMALVADFIGAAGDGALRVAELPTGDDEVTAYGAYSNGTLKRVAITNMKLWKQISNTERPVKAVSVNLHLPADIKQVKVERLQGPSGAMTTNITWAGTTWTKDSGGKPVQVQNGTDLVAVVNGKIILAIEATTAVLLSW
ncbi:hypothetical protein F4780DRAFT_764684 [Xylariomycetidae sp. FL0641]|nr:hypothetical protein F4780DRAFT_764684 [Xylariomycetidae sp. FL0641]